MKTTSKMKMSQQMELIPIDDYPNNEDDPNIDNNPKYNNDDPRNEDDSKNEDNLRIKTAPNMKPW